jgi:aminoglycoside phosphotransferase (APT) family kinase protein
MIAAERNLARDVVGWTLTRLRRDRVERRQPAQLDDLLRRIVTGMSSGADTPEWQFYETRWTSADIAVAAVGPPDCPPLGMVRMASALHAQRGLHQNAASTRALHTDKRVAEWSTHVPRPICEGAFGEWRYAVEQVMPGMPALSLPANPRALTQLQVASATTISQLHDLTASWLVVDDALLARWVDERLQRVREALAILPRPLRADTAIARVSSDLRRTLNARTIQAGWIHGDFWPGNVLVDPDRHTPVGIVDWEWSAAAEPPAHDLLHLILYTRCLTEQRELGDVLREALTEPRWTPIERYILSLGMPHDADVQRAMLLLYWLRHIVCNLDQSPHYARHHVWVARNINAVLRSL